MHTDAQPSIVEVQASALGRAVERLLVEAVRDLLEERPQPRDATACLASFLESHGVATLSSLLETDEIDQSKDKDDTAATACVVADHHARIEPESDIHQQGSGAAVMCEPEPEPENGLQPESGFSMTRDGDSRQPGRPIVSAAATTTGTENLASVAEEGLENDVKGNVHSVRVRMRKPKKGRAR